MFVILFVNFVLKMKMCYTKPNFYYINLEIRPQVVKYGTNLDSNVRYFCQEKDYRSLISGEVGLVPKIVRYWSFVIDYYCVYTKWIFPKFWKGDVICFFEGWGVN